MKVIRNINNNVSLCLDSKGREVVAFGKGIGFIKPPYDVPLEKIDRTFYSNNIHDYSVLQEVPLDVMEASIKIIDELEKNLNVTMMSSTALALADHINFAIKRNEQNIQIDMPIQEDLKQLYPQEVRFAEKSLMTIKEATGYELPKEEVGSLALHFINNQIRVKKSEHIESEMLVKEVTQIIERIYQINIDKESFNYSRFVTHMDYLLRRTLKNNQIQSINMNMYEEIKNKYEKAYKCSVLINELFKDRLNEGLSDEECLYLMLHINRMCTRV